MNVLSKMDLVERYGELDFGLDFYLQAQGETSSSRACAGQWRLGRGRTRRGCVDQSAA